MFARLTLMKLRIAPQEVRIGNLCEFRVIITCADMRTIIASLSFKSQ